MTTLGDAMTRLRRMLLTMSAEVEQRVDGAVAALIRHDLEIAEQVRFGDDEIDQMDLNVEAECLEIFALHQPVASDLRFLLATLRINGDLERIADLARGVARRALKLEGRVQITRPPVLADLARGVRAQVQQAIKALAEQDEELCLQIRAADRDIDQMYKAVFTWAAEEMQSHSNAAAAVIDILSIVRALERIADLAVNIAEAVVFSIEGTVVRHSPIKEIEGGAAQT